MYPGQSGFTSDNKTLVTVLSSLLPFFFCLSGWCPISQMEIFMWRSTFLIFFCLNLEAWNFLCLVCLALSRRSFVGFVFAFNASNFKKPTAKREKLLLATVSAVQHVNELCRSFNPASCPRACCWYHKAANYKKKKIALLANTGSDAFSLHLLWIMSCSLFFHGRLCLA